MSEIGYQSEAQGFWAGMAADMNEANEALVWPASIDTFDRMRREDPQVASVLRAVTLPIMQTEWMIDPAGARPEVVAHIAESLGLPVKGEAFTAPIRTRGRFAWSEHLRLSLLMLPFGHSFFEQVYDIDAGRARLAKLAWRPPRTISKVNVARDGGLVSIQQHGIAGKAEVTIPVSRVVAYVNEREGGNWFGTSLLRAAFKMWLLKDQALRIQAQAGDRNGLGMPVFEAPTPPLGLDADEADRWQKEQIAEGMKIAQAARSGNTSGVSLANGGKFSFVGVTGRLPDLDKQIRYYDEQIANALLAHFLKLGGDNATGSYALGSTFAKFFTGSLNAVSGYVAAITQQHVVEDLVDLNWGESEPAPRIVAAPIGEEQPITAEAIKALIECGALTKDPTLEAHLRAYYGLPVLAAELASKGVPVDAAREIANSAAELARKVYLATDKPPLRQDEARDLIRLAGIELAGDGPEVSRIRTNEPEEAA